MSQVGIFGNIQECYGVAPTFSGLTLLETARNLRYGNHFNDFIGNFDGDDLFDSIVNGASSIGHVNGNAARPGVLGFFCDTGYCAIRTDTWSFTLPMDLVFEVDLNVQVSDAVNKYVVQLGFGDQVNADQTDGVYFRYDDSESLNWQICAADGGVRTKVDSGIAVAGGYFNYKIVLGAARADFYINRVLVGTIATNIPTQFFGGMVGSYKTLGAGGKNMYLDWLWLWYRCGGAR